jgi:hypothetical protein
VECPAKLRKYRVGFEKYPINSDLHQPCEKGHPEGNKTEPRIGRPIHPNPGTDFSKQRVSEPLKSGHPAQMEQFWGMCELEGKKKHRGKDSRHEYCV